MEYIKSGGREEGCILCEAPRMRDEDALIVYRGEKWYVILNRYPYNSGHLMIVPYSHVPSLEDLGVGDYLEMGLLLNSSIIALRREYRPHGFNIGVNIGKEAGAGIEGHVHLHVVPRWGGDTNYMTTVGGVKVIPQALEESFRVLRPALMRAVEELRGQKP